jgi:hypothetical protein
VAALVVLSAVTLDRRLFRTRPPVAAAYHERLRQFAMQIPSHIDDWMGTDTEVPPAAVEMLHPNVIVSRRYLNIATGESVQFLLVQVQDARDILGHYPPVCYRGRGWTQQSAEPLSTSLGGLDVKGTRYTFTSTRDGQDSAIVVDNFLILPNGKTCPDMDAVDAAAQDNRMKFFGAAQVQVVYDQAVPPKRRDEVFRTFVGLSRGVVDKMQLGAER